MGDEGKGSLLSHLKALRLGQFAQRWHRQENRFYSQGTVTDRSDAPRAWTEWSDRRRARASPTPEHAAKPKSFPRYTVGGAPRRVEHQLSREILRPSPKGRGAAIDSGQQHPRATASRSPRSVALRPTTIPTRPGLQGSSSLSLTPAELPSCSSLAPGLETDARRRPYYGTDYSSTTVRTSEAVQEALAERQAPRGDCRLPERRTPSSPRKPSRPLPEQPVLLRSRTPSAQRSTTPRTSSSAAPRWRSACTC